MASTSAATAALRRSAQRSAQRLGSKSGAAALPGGSPFDSPVAQRVKLRPSPHWAVPGGAQSLGVSLRVKGMECTSVMLAKAGLSPRAVGGASQPAYMGNPSPASLRRRKRQNREKPWLIVASSAAARGGGGATTASSTKGLGEGSGAQDFWLNPEEERVIARAQRRAQAGHRPSPGKAARSAARAAADYSLSIEAGTFSFILPLHYLMRILLTV